MPCPPGGRAGRSVSISDASMKYSTVADGLVDAIRTSVPPEAVNHVTWGGQSLRSYVQPYERMLAMRESAALLTIRRRVAA